ncbi:MAG: hypothetical protein ACKN9D_16495 [Actinomycetales bacterium]
MRTQVHRALIGLIAVGTSLALAAPTSAAVGQEGLVPVPNGRYGALWAAQGPCLFNRDGELVVGSQPSLLCYAPQSLIMFTVRNRRIVNPRVMLTVTCRYTDGTTSDVIFGPTSNNADRTAPIPRSGNGNVSWVEEFDSSLIRDATVTVNMTRGLTMRRFRTVNMISDCGA